MEVSHVKDHVTHAVIGGGENIGFGISDSAEFFNILSSTLYKDQKLAVIREVLCNAWDAHIAANKQNVPVQITLTREEFIIRDYGFGIPHDKIGPIYTVYGNSTKKHDGQQTGGFGLGCKAPFAYTDHFEVTSWAGGMKSLYNVSKSAAEVMGKPGMKLIQQVPCGDETGLQVRIKLKDVADKATFTALIGTIARNGEMNMELNHEKLETIPFSQMTLDFLITTRLLISNGTRIQLRYGNVIYPVSIADGFMNEFIEVEKILKTLAGGENSARYGYKQYYLILQAPPHSISVTPSREELSMQDHTVNTLKKLLGTFLARFERDYEGEAMRLLDQCIDSVWQKKEYNELLSEAVRIPGNVNMQLSMGSHITTIPALVRYHTAAQYPKFKNFRKLEIMKRVESMIAHNWGNRGLLQAYLALLNQVDTVEQFPPGNTSKWFYDHIAKPLLRGMDQNDLLDPKRLFTVGYGIRNGGDYMLTSSNKNKEMIRSLDGLEPTSVMKMWPYLRNIVVLSYTRNDVANRLSRFPEVRDTGGKMNYGFMLYVVPRNAARVEAARSFFQAKHGVTFIDLTVAAEWEHNTVVAPVERVYVRRKKQEGWPCMTSIMSKGGVAMELGRSEHAARITNPKWFCWLTTKTKNTPYPNTLDRYDQRETAIILELWADQGAIALTKAAEEKLIAAGAKPLQDFVRDTVIEEMEKSDSISHYMAEKKFIENLNREDRVDHLQMITKSSMLREHFGLPKMVTQREAGIIKLWSDVRAVCVNNYHSHRNWPAAKVLATALDEELQVNPVLVQIYKQLMGSDMLQFLDVGYLTSAFANKSDAGLRKKALDLYLQAINN